MPLKQVSNQLVTISVILSAPGTAAATSTLTTPTSSTTATTTTSALAVSKTFFQTYFSVRVVCQKFCIRSRRRRPSPPPSSLRVNTKLRHQFFLSLSQSLTSFFLKLSLSYRRFPSKTNAGSFWFQPKLRLELFRIFLSSECHFFIFLFC